MSGMSTQETTTTVAVVTDNDEVTIDAGSEEHVCRKDVSVDRQLGPATTAMRDVAGRPITNYGTKELKMMLADKESGQVRSKISWQVGEVEKNVFRAGKVTGTGAYRLILDSDGSYLSHKQTGKSAMLKREGFTFA